MSQTSSTEDTEEVMKTKDSFVKYLNNLFPEFDGEALNDFYQFVKVNDLYKLFVEMSENPDKKYGYEEVEGNPNLKTRFKSLRMIGLVDYKADIELDSNIRKYKDGKLENPIREYYWVFTPEKINLDPLITREAYRPMSSLEQLFEFYIQPSEIEFPFWNRIGIIKNEAMSLGTLPEEEEKKLINLVTNIYNIMCIGLYNPERDLLDEFDLLKESIVDEIEENGVFVEASDIMDLFYDNLERIAPSEKTKGNKLVYDPTIDRQKKKETDKILERMRKEEEKRRLEQEKELEILRKQREEESAYIQEMNEKIAEESFNKIKTESEPVQTISEEFRDVPEGKIPLTEVFETEEKKSRPPEKDVIKETKKTVPNKPSPRPSRKPRKRKRPKRKKSKTDYEKKIKERFGGLFSEDNFTSPFDDSIEEDEEN